jgi:hypothetical protein
MMRKFQPSWTLLGALVAFTLGPLLLAIDSRVANSSYWSWTFISLVIMPFGMDMSFPAATLIMSNYFPPQMQGIAGSLISTTVNYSISLGLGLASTVEVHVNDNGRDLLMGIRGAWFMGVGLGGLGILICLAFVVKSSHDPRASDTTTSRPSDVSSTISVMHITQPQSRIDIVDEPRVESVAARRDTSASQATTMAPNTTSTAFSAARTNMDTFKSTSKV